MGETQRIDGTREWRRMNPGAMHHCSPNNTKAEQCERIAEHNLHIGLVVAPGDVVQSHPAQCMHHAGTTIDGTEQVRTQKVSGQHGHDRGIGVVGLGLLDEGLEAGDVLEGVHVGNLQDDEPRRRRTGLLLRWLKHLIGRVDPIGKDGGTATGSLDGGEAMRDGGGRCHEEKSCGGT